MAARELAPGQHGEITVSAQRRDGDGKWKTCTARQAQRWRAQVYVRDWQGVRHPISRFGETSGKARTRAELAIKEVLNPNKGQGNHHITASTLFGDAVDHWLTEAKRTDSGLSPRSIFDYERVVKRHIKQPGSALRKVLKEQGAAIRDVKLVDANDPQRLKRFLQAVADVHGTATAKVTRSVIANVLNLALSYGVFTMSALKNVPQVKSQTPRAPKPDREARDTRRALTREERAVLLARADAKAVPDPGQPYDPRTQRKWQTAADLLAFMAGTGVRVSEVRRLRWGAVDMGCLGATVIGKGHRGEPRPRHVDFPPSLVKRMLRRQETTGGQGFVFASPTYLDSEHEWDQSNCAKALSRLIVEAGFSWATPHSLRRTVATLAHKDGAPLVDIADQLGHANPTMTAQVYLGRNWMGPRRSVADLLDDEDD